MKDRASRDRRRPMRKRSRRATRKRRPRPTRGGTPNDTRAGAIGKKVLPGSVMTPYSLYTCSNWRLSSNHSWSDQYDSNFPKQAPPQLMSHKQIQCGDVIYCESSEVAQLMDLLKVLSVPIILVTGRRHTPSFVSDPVYICEHPFVRKWFAQNPIINSPKVEVIPYGVLPDHLPNLESSYTNLAANSQTRTIPILHVGLASNYPLRCKISPKVPSRENLIKTQDQRVSQGEYFELLAKSVCVISPCGDRCDCYRHVEAILLGCVPITNMPKEYAQLYGDVTINVDTPTLEWIGEKRQLPAGTVIPQITRDKQEKFYYEYWHKKVQEAQSMVKLGC